MEYKIFGPGGTPSIEIRDQLKEFLKLDEAQRKIVRDAFLSDDFEYSWREPLPEAVAASSLLPEQFTGAVELIRSLLYAWREYNLQLADIERDFLLLGCSERDISVLVGFLHALAGLKDSIWTKRLKSIQQLDGLPTIDNLNIICDARAVFGGFPEGAEHVNPSYKTLLDLQPMVIMEIISSDNYGNRQRTGVQMNEEQFEAFQRIVGRAQEQFATLKKRIEKSSDA